MSDVPSDVLCEILGQVPAESLFHFRTVCKSWRRIIDDPSFIKSHTNNQLSSTNLLIRNSTGSLYSLSLDSLIYADGQQTINVTHVKTLIRRGVPRLPDLPLPKLDTDLCLMGRGLGYDYAADDYKVVRIDKKYHHGKFGLRTLSNPAVTARNTYQSKGTSQNAFRCVEWMLSSELHYTIEGLDGWVMKDYGVEKSWMKLFSIGGLDIICAMGGLRPVAYLKSKGQVLLQHDSKFLWLDIEKNSVKKVTIHGLPNFLSSQICPGSLLRLNDSGGVGGSVVAARTAGVKRKRKKANTRLQLCVTTTDVWRHSNSSCRSDSS
ncbi:hypothetical protein Pfo_000642 [Paulownia fortunei]|nr:hypothetical protein Pfo_000642 [Paulownia fortunei]